MPNRLMVRTTIAVIAGLTVGAATLSQAAPPTPSPTQTVGRADIQGVEGEMGLSVCPSCLEVNSVDFLATKSAGKSPAFRRFEIVSPIDSASPQLLERLALGTSIPSVKVSLVKAGSTAFVYKLYTLTNAKVISLHEYASGQGSDVPQLAVGFSFGKVKVEYMKQDPDGSAGETIEFCWNLQSDEVC